MINAAVMGYVSAAVIRVDLTAECFKPGRPGYERVKNCLERLQLQADFILTCDSSGKQLSLVPQVK